MMLLSSRGSYATIFLLLAVSVRAAAAKDLWSHIRGTTHQAQESRKVSEEFNLEGPIPEGLNLLEAVPDPEVLLNPENLLPLLPDDLIPEVVSELPDDIVVDLFDIPDPIAMCEIQPDFELYQTTETQIEAFFESSLASLGSIEDVLSAFEPKTVLCVGCSKGIGRANACHWASRDGTEKIISLATTTVLDPVRCPSGADETKIKNIVYDIAKAEKGMLSLLLQAEGVQYIDLTLLSAVRDMAGSMRIFDADDLVESFLNNLAGHHGVWQEARDYFSPELAVVMGITSVAAESRFFAGRNFYHMTKQGIVDLVLGYAIEEAYVQPNTHYAVMYQGDVKGTNYGMKQIHPRDASHLCKESLKDFGSFSNIYINSVGLDSMELARFYHKAYAMIAGYKYLNQTDGSIPRGDVPQTFAKEPVGTYTPLRNMQYNHRILPPGVVYECYASLWDDLKGARPWPAFYFDPREHPALC